MNSQASVHRKGALTTRMRRGTIICPVCNHDAGIRDSEQETELVKSLNCHCLNVTCGHTFKMQLSFVYTISPSAIDRPDLNLPQAPAHFLRHIYPAGPPGARSPEPDPDQLVMFEPGEDQAPEPSTSEQPV
jgi:hypothetical protein